MSVLFRYRAHTCLSRFVVKPNDHLCNRQSGYDDSNSHSSCRNTEIIFTRKYVTWTDSECTYVSFYIATGDC